VATWAAFEAAAPDLVSVAEGLWPGVLALGRGMPSDALPHPVFSVAYLATTRRDGAPRVHPFCPVIAGGRLFAAIPRSSPKGWDLRRDPRAAIHALPGPEDDERCLRVDLVRVDVARWLDIGLPGTRAVRRHWREER
jgi:hypothetical protein